MNNSSYWNSVYNQWKDRANGVNASTYYNQTFIDRMNAAQDNIDNLVKSADQANSKVQASKDEYDTFKGEMRHYSEVDKENEEKFGVKTVFDEYEKSKDAVIATQTMINALPSSINANSNRVLTQSQREAAFQREYNRSYGRKLDIETSTANKYEETWKKARENATKASLATMNMQQANLENFNKAWASAVDNWNQAQRNVNTARYEKMNIESQYRQWQDQQAAAERKKAMMEMSAALDKYVASLKNENTMRVADLNARISNIDNSMNRVRQATSQALINYYQMNNYGYTPAF